MQDELKRLSRLVPSEVANEQARSCPFCGRQFEPRKHEYALFGKTRVLWIWPDKCGCDAECEHIATQNANEAQTAIEKRQAEYDARLTRAGLDGLLRGYTFASFDDRPEWDKAANVRAIARNYSNALLNDTLNGRPWLIFHGEFGTGKSHLAGAIVREAVDNNWHHCYFRVWTRYLRRLQDTWGKRDSLNDEFGAESEADIIDELVKGQLVVIDDLDKRDGSEWVRGVLFDVINTRYNAQLPTVLTFNRSLSDNALGDIIGRAVLDRIVEHAFAVVEFEGPSYRMR